MWIEESIIKMESLNILEPQELELICGEDTYGSWFHPNTWWNKFEGWIS